MAEIFLARNATGAGIERIVVLKRILPQCANDVDLVRMFVHEARLAAQLQHANIAQVYDVGKLGSSYFFTMEYVHGQTVRDVMLHARQRRLRIPIAAVLTIAAGAAAGLHHAHERRGIDGRPLGIVHSDVSPSNLMISQEGVVKLVDFGIARAAGSTATDGALRGKISYLSPEQCHSSKQLDRRSDLFSLGIVLWEMLTLQGLFRRGSDFENMVAIESEPTLAPSAVTRDVPRELDALVARLLAKSPHDRYQTAAELLEAIEATALRLGCVLSPTSLARMMHEWFGAKPEPWIRGSSNQLVVASEPVPESFVKTLAPDVDDQLKTLPPTASRPDDIPGDTIRDESGKTESLEQLRDRLFKEAMTRKASMPHEDPDDARATLPRMRPPSIIRDAPRATPQPRSVPVSTPVPEAQAAARRATPWAVIILSTAIVACVVGIVLVLAS